MVVPVEAAELASVVGPVQKVEKKESKREEKSKVESEVYWKCVKRTWQSCQFLRLN